MHSCGQNSFQLYKRLLQTEPPYIFLNPSRFFVMAVNQLEPIRSYSALI